MPSIKDVAKRAGVSTATVSRYINKNTYVDEAKVLAIKEAMDFYHYAPSQFGRGLVKQKTNLIGVYFAFAGVGSLFDSIYNTELLRGIEEALNDTGYSMVMLSEDAAYFRGENDLPKYLDFIRQKRMDGLIISGLTTKLITEGSLKELSDLNFPVVYIGKKLFENDLNIYAQFTKYRTAMVKKLAEYGHKKILMFIFRQHDYFEKELLESVAKEVPQVEFKLLTIDNANQDTLIIKDILKQWHVDEGYTGFCLPDIQSSMLFYNACLEMEISIPKDISVIAVENKLGEGKVTFPETSVYNTRVSEMGRQAAKLLLSRILGEDTKETTLEFESTYIERNSIRKI